MPLKNTTKKTVSEIEAIARRLIRKTCPSDLLDVVSLSTDRANGLIFIVLKCRELKKESTDALSRRDAD
jgi:hypothetical protein